VPKFAEDYVMVNERIAAFRKMYPDGSLQSDIIELTENRILMRGLAYRTPDDERPGIGHSWLEIPGKTAFTRGSEVENCETSAWGRALAALGFEVKRGVASLEEILNKDDGTDSEVEIGASAVPGIGPGGKSDKANVLQVRQAKILSHELDLGTKGFRDAIERILGDALTLPDDEDEAAKVLTEFLEDLGREDIGTLIQGLAAEVEALGGQGDREPEEASLA
jgi:hypothetical protein